MAGSMIKRLKYISILLLAAAAYNTAAQNSQVLYYMNLPQKHFLNPALRPSNSVYIGLPVLSGININFNNNFINFSDVFMKSASGDSVISIFHPNYDIDRFMPKIKDINSFEIQTMIQLFGLGFNAGKDLYVFFDVNTRVEGNIALPGDIIRLGLLGNEQFVGDKIDLSALRTDVKLYNEAGLGFSKNFTDRLRVGLKGKMLSGIGTASLDNNSLGVTVNEDYTHVFDADMSANLSAPLIYYEDPEGNIDSIKFDEDRFDTAREIIDYLLSSKNKGFGLDIGAEYKITDRLAVSAAVTDLGYIKWKRDAKNLNAKSSFEFSGIDMLDVYDREISLDSLGKELQDSLMNSFSYNSSELPFTTYLPIGISAGGSYNLTNSVSVGVLSYTRLIGKQIREALTLSANLNLSNAFSVSLAYTAANHRYDNLGFGLAFRPGIFQIYFLADRIPVTWNKVIMDGNTIPLPASWNTVHLRFGMNLAFGNVTKKKVDKPMLPPDENTLIK